MVYNLSSGSRVWLEKQGSTTTATYTYGSALIRKDGEYPLYDGHGSERTVTDASQNVTGTLNLDAFGNLAGSTGSSSNPYMYCGAFGYRNDAGAGLALVGARYYDYQVGRFITRDTVLSEHPYLYCEGDPVNAVDPSGHDWLDDASNFFAGRGDTITFGLTDKIRSLIGVNDVVDHDSGWYTGGGIAGDVWWIGFSGAVGAKALGWNTKIAIHGPHHSFGMLGKLYHLQLNWWRVGVKGSGRVFRIPLPWR